MTEPEAAPGGTVTFLFSDIEGSTRLEQALGTERYGEVLERHRALLRAAWQANGGIEQGTEGDSFFVMFGRATSALAAADRRPARARTARPGPTASTSGSGWGSTPAKPSDRSGGRRRRHGRPRHQPGGAHRGGGPRRPDPRVRRDERAARRRTCRPTSRCATWARFRLKDLLAPVHLVQVDRRRAAARSSRAPRTLDAHPNNLPTQLTTFVGRDAELAEAGDPARHDPAADADRARAARARRDCRSSSPHASRTTSRTACSSCRSSRSATRCWSPPGSPAPSASSEADRPADRRYARGLAARQGASCSCSTTSSRSSRRRRSSPTCCGPRPRIKIVVTSRAALRVSGEQEYPVPGLPAPPGSQPPERARAAGHARRVARRRPGRDRAVRRRAPVHRARGGGPAGLHRHQRERAGGGGHLRPAPRHAAGHRAGRGADQAPVARGDPRPARAPARPAGRRRARPAAAPADAARRDRLELRHPRRGRQAAARPAVGVRRRVRPRRRPRRSAGRRRRSAATSSTG